MANGHPQFDGVPQFEGVTNVKLWEAEHKDETKLRLGPRLFRRGFLGQP